MSLTQRYLTIGFGIYFAAVLYFKIAMGKAQIFSYFAFDLAALIALISIPAVGVALNIGRRTVWTAIGSGLLMLFMFCWMFMNAFFAGMPGIEWIDRGQMDMMLILPLMCAVALPLRLKAAIPILAKTSFASLVLFVAVLPISMRYLLDNQIHITRLNGGCVEAGSRSNILSAQDIQLGWFVGSSSEQVRFIEKQGYSKWSYSSFGVAKRRDMPIVFEPDEKTNLIKCLSSKIQ